jgi:hypothetical protein
MELSALSRRWFPLLPVTTETMGEALYLDRRELERLEIAVNNGIARAMGH